MGSFAELHSRSTQRPHDAQLDGFDMSVDAWVSCHSLQVLAALLTFSCSGRLAGATAISGMLSPECAEVVF